MNQNNDYDIIVMEDVKIGDRILIKYFHGCYIFLEYKIIDRIGSNFKVKNLISNNFLWVDMHYLLYEEHTNGLIYRLKDRKDSYGYDEKEIRKIKKVLAESGIDLDNKIKEARNKVFEECFGFTKKEIEEFEEGEDD